MKNSILFRSEINGLVESSTLAINQHVAKLRNAQQSIFHFGFGESPFPLPAALKNALINNAHQKSYLPTQGLLSLREAIGDFYQNNFSYSFDAEHIFIGPGSKELLFQLLFLLEGKLLLPSPSWVSYAPQAQLCGKETLIIPTRFEDGYQISPDALDDACLKSRSSQHILIVNYPNNPTGQCLDLATAKALAEVCRKHQIIVISDEIYALTQHDGGQHVSIVHHYPEATIVTGGLSKAFSAGGYRLGIALLPDNQITLRDNLVKLISETFSAVSAPIQYAAQHVYSNYESVRNHVDACTQLHALAGMHVYQRFQAMGLRCLKPQGGFYLFPDFSPYAAKLQQLSIHNDKDLTQHLLKHYAIACLPGSDFNSDTKSLCVRIAYVDYDGTDVLDSYLKGERDPIVLFSQMEKACDRLNQFLLTLAQEAH